MPSVFLSYPLLFLIVLVLLASIKVINEYERGILFTLGRFSRVMTPGWRLVVPVFQSYQKVDIRTKAVDVPHQEAITKDNIPVSINAVIYYNIQDAEKAVLAVEDFFWAMSQMAQTTMRNAVGATTLDELLQNRDKVSQGIREIIDAESDSWGIKVSSVELKDVILPQELKRTISKEAEAEREKRAVIIKAEGDRIAADNLAEAARVLGSSPGAMHLRTLQTVNDLSSDQSNTTIWLLPIEVLEALKGLQK
ncbi:slipin family protein [Candidatus Peribacteria bacterium]|nr:slipin family protein [Candidatus Peribacteria bacterium]